MPVVLRYGICYLYVQFFDWNNAHLDVCVCLLCNLVKGNWTGCTYAYYSYNHTGFLILEAIFATQAMQSSTCMTALDNADANGRMLPIILYVYMSFDCLMLFILLCFSCVACCAISSEK